MASWYAPGMAIKGNGLQIMWYMCPVTVGVPEFIQYISFVCDNVFVSQLISDFKKQAGNENK